MSLIRILVVEDEPIVAEDIASRLTRMGYEVVGIVESGEAAIALAEATLPSLVLMDIILEGELDGIEAAEWLRANLEIPVVYLTANADESTLQRAKATIPFGYILKPFKERELQATIEIAISRHQAEQEVRRALAEQQLWQSLTEPGEPPQPGDEDRAQYLMMAVHELRTPLSIVKVSASLLRERGSSMSEGDRNRNLAYIENAVGSMNDLLEDVLTLSKVNRCRLDFKPEALDLETFCENLVDAMRWSLGEQYQLVFVATGERYVVSLDHKLIWHALNNLLSNAIKYSPPASTVALDLVYQPEAVVIRVTDQGIGIPPEDHARLFEPFHRAQNVGSIAGTGLGLAISKHCVELHGGNICFSSVLGSGTTFTITLPRQQEPAEN
jgi:signal transduction histidine kinase